MDNTYHELLKYIETTQEVATCALRQLDKNAEFHIVDSLDLGIPYDVDRLAGGFPTGVYVYWHCKEPVIPIDTTVNCCTASIFTLGKILDFDQEGFINNLANLDELWKNGLYCMNFNRGNHFISLCIDENQVYYLIMHSTAKEFTKCYNGLYPVSGNWYYDKIRVFQKGKRYFRYIKGKEAILFANTAISINKYNEIRHENIAYSILNNLGVDTVEINHYHHYGMDNNNTIKIGCYTVDRGSIFPIFSKPSYPIDLYRVSNCMKKTPLGKFIVPHGWGKKYLYPLQICCDYKRKELKIGGRLFGLFSDESLYGLSDLAYRDFETHEGVNSFYDCFKSELDGEVSKRLFQIVCMSAFGIETYDL